ncbi:hypothetical protein GCM10009735_36320 [Actinomadura chokoriensis]
MWVRRSFSSSSRACEAAAPPGAPLTALLTVIAMGSLEKVGVGGRRGKYAANFHHAARGRERPWVLAPISGGCGGAGAGGAGG